MPKTKDEAKRHRTASFIFSKAQTLDFMCMRDNLAKNKAISKHNHEIKMLKELSKKHKCSSDKIEDLKLKDTIL